MSEPTPLGRRERNEQQTCGRLTAEERIRGVFADYPPLFLAQMVAAVYVSTIRYWRQDTDYDLADGFGKAARTPPGRWAPGVMSRS